MFIISIGNYKNQAKMESIPNYYFQEEQKIRNGRKQGDNTQQWRDLFLKDDIKRVIRQYRFEHPSQVQAKTIPFALEGNDIICQSKSGTGKTMVFVISILQLLVMNQNGQYLPRQALVIANTRELAHQIYKIFLKMSKYFQRPPLRISCFFGGLAIQDNFKELTNHESCPHIVIGTPGRLLDLALRKYLDLSNCNFFVIDQCDKILQNLDTNDIIRQLLDMTPMKKQIMMFSATLNEKKQRQCHKFMFKPIIILIDQGKLVLNGLTQFYLRLPEQKKFDKLIHLLDNFAFNQVIIFVNRVDRARKLTDLLKLKLFNPICIHSSLKQEQRIKNYDLFKANNSRLLVATDLFGRGVDIQRVNFVINYDFPTDRDTYLHRVGRAGRFNTQGLVINFLNASGQDDQILVDIQNGYQVKIEELTNKVDPEQFI